MYISIIAKDYLAKCNEIEKLVKESKDEALQLIRNAEVIGYQSGYKDGIDKGYEIGSGDICIQDIDYESIKKFASFCYMHGIDFSYMAKAPGDDFIDRVIKKFKEEVEFKCKNRNELCQYSEKCKDSCLMYEDE